LPDEHHGSPAVWASRRRTLSGGALVLALILPARDSWQAATPQLRWWLRLHSEHKVASDLVRDAYYRQLLPYLPSAGTVALLHAGAGTPIDRAMTHYWLQYSLAPHFVVESLESTDSRFVIVAGRAPTGSPLVSDPTFELVRSVDDELAVYRRVTK
jgi:hypothetical protein